MSTFFKCISLLLLNMIVHVICIGKFYTIIFEEEFPMTTEKPVLSVDIFKCNRQDLCATVPFTAETSEKEGKPNHIAIFEKTNDPSAQYRTCANALKMNDGKEGYYHIKHSNMRQSLEVECKIINNTIFAVIHHDSETLTKVAGKESPCSFSKPIKYVANWDGIVRFVDSSTKCRQLTTFNCKHSQFFDSKNHYSYVVDRNRNFMAYIGGGPENGKGCSCGISKTCAERGAACNCNKNDKVWRSDSGYVTEKYRLPLTKVCIGETGSSYEKMDFKIGPVECISEA